jgi:uncharacterized membrane protein YebE (DUF533 family)
MKITNLVLTLTLAFGLSQLAYAKHDGKEGGHCSHKKHSMQDADVNKDGKISRDEFMTQHQTRANEMFAKLDANKDGNIDQAERDAMKAKWKEHHNSDNHNTGLMEHGAEHK